MTAPATFLVHCPQITCAGCGGEAVEATYLEATVEVAPCQPLQAQGWGTDPAVVLWNSQALEMLRPYSEQPARGAWQHAEGLVVFA